MRQGVNILDELMSIALDTDLCFVGKGRLERSEEGQRAGSFRNRNTFGIVNQREKLR